MSGKKSKHKAVKRQENSRKWGMIKLAAVLLILICSIGGAAVCLNQIELGLDLAGGVSIAYQTEEEHPSPETMRDILYKLQRRVEVYSTEAEVYQEGSNQINVDIPGVTDANAIAADLGAPGTLQFVDEAGRVLLSGDQIADAKAGYRKNAATGSIGYVVELIMSEDGGRVFAEATKENLDKTILIMYDGETVSAPLIRTPVTSGKCYIELAGSMEDAKRLAMTIRIGALPMALQEVRSTSIGAKLGEEAIGTSLLAAVVGLILVMILMCAVYRGPGVAASAALLLYVALMTISLWGFGLTLTLPGLAGIVLGIGMAVDANVIVFARIQEELSSGKSVSGAIRGGFVKARSAILDGNITTLLVALILHWKGAGTIKGFAQALALGIGISMVTTLLVTRITLTAFYEVYPTKTPRLGKIKQREPIVFVGKKRYFVFSGLALAVGAGMMMYHGRGPQGTALEYSLEFSGGNVLSIDFDEDMTLEQITERVLPVVKSCVRNGQMEVQSVVGTTGVIIKTRRLSTEEQSRIQKALNAELQVDPSKITMDSISATVGDRMREDAIMAVVLAISCMLIYIWFRFQDVWFGVSAVLALVHDVFIVITVYACLRMPVGNTFVACVLTIVGYSINATIVVFDRMREHLRESGTQWKLQDVANRSITETLGRSVYTSLTTFVMALALYVFGVRGIQEFAVPLMVGIMCGTYSSVCLTGAMWCSMRMKFSRNEG